MADYNICKVPHSGCGYSVVDLNDVRHVFAAAAPMKGATFDEQAADALGAIEAVLREEAAQGSIVHQTIFLADISHAGRCREIMREFYGPELPATSYIPQPPCGGKLLVVEALGVEQGRGEVKIERVAIERVSEELVIARHNGLAWVHCTQALPRGDGQPAYDASLGVMRQVCQRLGSVNVGFHQVIRTWFYLGGITDCDEGTNGSMHAAIESHRGERYQVERYQEFNRARTDFFSDIGLLPGLSAAGSNGPAYPASTGIGTNGRGIAMSAVALVADRNDIGVVPLESPRQTAACDYAAAYGPHSPKFSRAMAVTCGTHATIFISGTASICLSQTLHPSHAVQQAEEPLDNIAALISEENVARHGLSGLGTSLAGLALVRVYIKRPQDYQAVRAVCERRLGTLPAVFAFADICRPDLLVEIEGVAFSRLAG
jgi:enamine deaminase RidA (YjgF/YER057c/UK114 family)